MNACMYECMNDYDLMNGFFPIPPVLHWSDQNQMITPELMKNLWVLEKQYASSHTGSHLLDFLTPQFLPHYITTFTLIFLFLSYFWKEIPPLILCHDPGDSLSGI